ncbi:TonB-dependent receptor plug domain-containing protein [Flavobacterium psychrophilum]|uniref:TonB-dependent receptor plug domain-containing protein n=1 Tax=Flavobacterium psychrophilum TaxID=96345 RepID=UPI000B8E6246|nr:TonB-dependent receptor [Flavobacterium psychrophilum]
MTLRNYILFCLIFLCQLVLAQNDTITNLKEVVVSDTYLHNNNKSQSIQVLNDSVIIKNQSSLASLLNYNSTIYFKEYGRGMLSTVSFRGTTSAQTAVIWNGININSQLNGSTDFNTVTGNDYATISVKAGGGSVIYGSGAVGGSVHLNNNLSFKKQFTNTLQLSYGSFDTSGINYKTLLSNEKWSAQIGFSYHESKNEYPYIELFNWKGAQRKNLNGEYLNISLNANIGYKINSNNLIKLYSQTSNTDRHLSLVSESDTKTKYVNSFSRNLLEYDSNFYQYSINLKSAYIIEEYQYFANIASDYFSFGKSESAIAKLDFSYQILKSLKINTILDYSQTKGYGTSFGNNTRKIGSAALLVKQQLGKKWQNELGIRQEITDNYKSPLLLSAGTSRFLNNWYTVKINFSRNYRMPTFNDLYWEGTSDHGNPNLKVESSYQAEVGNVFSFKKIKLSQTFYCNKIKDLISWKPGDGGGWTPQNTNKVTTYGLETVLGWANNIGKHLFSMSGSYAYTISQDEETKKQLFFVPFHKITASVGYSYKNFAVNYQFLYNGFVYTRSDNDPKEIIKSYKVSNIGIDYDFKFLSNSKLGFQVLNLFNKKYQTLEDRPSPGRNFNIYITLKF